MRKITEQELLKKETTEYLYKMRKNTTDGLKNSSAEYLKKSLNNIDTELKRRGIA